MTSEGGDTYRMSILKSEQRAVLSQVVPAPADATLAIDAWMLAAADQPRDRFVTVTCRSQPAGSGYRLKVVPDAHVVSLARLDNGVELPLGERTLPALSGSESHNAIELSCVGSTISASINGAEAAVAHDATYTQGGFVIGGGADSGVTRKVEILFKLTGLEQH